MGERIRVLVIEDSAEDTELLLQELRRGGFEPDYERVETAETLNAALDHQTWDVIFADYRMPQFNGVLGLTMVRGRGFDTPFIFVSGTIGEDAAVAAMKEGANDYIMKGNTKRLLPAVEREMREASMRRERKEAQEQLQQSEERFRQLAENINEVFFLIGPDAKTLIYISPAYEQVWGRSRESLYADPFSWLEGLHPEDRPRVEVLLKNVENFQTEFRVVRSDGMVRWIWSRTFPIKDEKGAVYRLAGIAEDITERKRAEQELQQSEERFRQMAENITEVFWMTNPDKNKILYISPAYEKIWGRTCEGLYARPGAWLDAIHPEDREKISKSAIAKQTRGAYDEEYRIIRPDGSVRWIRDRAFPIKDKSGQVYRITGIAEDITGRKEAEQQLRLQSAALRSAANAIEITDRHVRVLWVNPAFVRNTGYALEEVVGQISQLFKSERMSGSSLQDPWRTVLSGAPWQGEIATRRKDGSLYPEEMTITPVRDERGEIAHFIAIKQDITARKQAEEALIHAKEFSENLIQTANVIILGLNTNGHIDIFNQAAEEITGYSFSEVKGKNWFEIFTPKKRFPQVWEEFNRLLAGGVCKTFENPILNKSGEESYIIWQNSQVKIHGKIVATISFGNDITERRHSEELVQHMAFYDLVTDLPNRNNLIDRMRNAMRLNAEVGNPMALMIMDLDRFKEINDTLGHHRGDLLLREVGSRLKSVLFKPDIVAHLGGDEFAVLLMRLARAEDIHLVIQKVQNILKPPFLMDGLPVAVEPSIGIALYPAHGRTPEDLLQRADIALHLAKGGSSGQCLYDPAIDRHSPQRLALMAELRLAIEEEQLVLHYQPQINLKNRKMVGAEALVRWKHPERGMIPPDQFIGTAERTGLIHPLTHWVLQAAIRRCGAWRQAGLGIVVCANLSARNLLDPNLPHAVAELLREGDIAPDCIQFEITESTIMADPVRAQETLLKLHEIGIRFAIDDFGVGYCSLSYLQRLPVDLIKIDKSFVIHMTQSKGDAKIVRSTIDLAHNLGLGVVAEGVETEEILDRLDDMNCDAAQGYYFSKPLPAEEFTRWVRESPWGLKSNPLQG